MLQLNDVYAVAYTVLNQESKYSRDNSPSKRIEVHLPAASRMSVPSDAMKDYINFKGTFNFTGVVIGYRSAILFVAGVYACEIESGVANSSEEKILVRSHRLLDFELTNH